MLDNQIVETINAGNGSTVVPYPVLCDFTDPDTIKASKCAPGTGTVTVTAGVAVFSSAQATLIVGSRLRIGALPGALNTLYEIAERTDSQNFKLRTLSTIAAVQFFLTDDATILVQDVDFTLTGTSLKTTVAVPVTSIVLIWRETPLVNTLDLPATGPMLPEDINRAFDYLTRITQEISNTLSQTGLGKPPPGASALLQDTTFFADAAARALAVPSRINQLGVQVLPSPFTLWRGTATTAGAWEQFKVNTPSVISYATVSAMNAAAPDYVGQIAWPADSQLEYRSTGTSVGNWTAAGTRVASDWVETPWTGQEALAAGDSRWIGSSGLARFIKDYTNTPYLVAGTMGYGPVTVRAKLRQIGGAYLPFTDTDFTIPAGSLTITGTISALILAAAPTRPFDSMQVQVIAVGESVTLATAVGSTQITPGVGSGAFMTTGSRLNSPLSTSSTVLDWYVVAQNGDGSMVMSHPAAEVDAALVASSEGAIFARLITFASTAAGMRTITIDTTSLSLVRVGDEIVGPTIEPGTIMIEDIGTSIILSKPLNGATTYLTILNRERPPVVHFKGISGVITNTVITVPDTTRIRVGDSVVGTNTASLSRVTAKSSSTITLSAGLTGSITELTVTYPTRTVASATSGDNVLTLNAGDIGVGCKVSGPGVLADTYVQSMAAVFLGLTKKINKTIAAATLTFSRDELLVVGDITSGDSIIYLTVAASTTAIEIGYLIEGDEFAPGTLVTNLSGSQVTISQPAVATNHSANVKYRRLKQWKGLSAGVFSAATAA